MNLTFIRKSIFGGILISLGGCVFLSAGGIIGAILFAFGLSSVILSESNLFTGKSGFCENKKDYFNLIGILLLNFVGCFFVALLTNHSVDSLNIIEKRIATSFTSVFSLSICTGIIMTLSVAFAKYKQNWLPLMLGVPLFILSGMPHCIADAYYYFIAMFKGYWWENSLFLTWGVSIIGNFLGCIIPTKIFNI